MSIKSFRETMDKCISPFMEIVPFPDATPECETFRFESRSVWVISDSVTPSPSLLEVMRTIAKANDVAIIQDNGKKFMIAPTSPRLEKIKDFLGMPQEPVFCTSCMTYK
jgi:hypothetical protein